MISWLQDLGGHWAVPEQPMENEENRRGQMAEGWKIH